MPPGCERVEISPQVDELQLRHLGSRDYVLVSATDPPVRVSTVLVSAPDEQALEEMKLLGSRRQAVDLR